MGIKWLKIMTSRMKISLLINEKSKVKVRAVDDVVEGKFELSKRYMV